MPLQRGVALGLAIYSPAWPSFSPHSEEILLLCLLLLLGHVVLELLLHPDWVDLALRVQAQTFPKVQLGLALVAPPIVRLV